MSSADETTHLLNGQGANDPLKYEAVTTSRVEVAEPKEGHTSGDGEKIKIYWWRWVVLVVFTSSVAANVMICITFGSIADVVSCYYGVSEFWVNSLVMVFLLTYLVLIFPTLWLANAVGFRATVVIAACCNILGASLRMAAAGRQYFWLLLTGQTVASMTNLLLWGGPAYLSSVWFPPSQRCLATAIAGALGPQLGMMIGFLSPILVRSEDTNTVCSGNATSDQQHQWTETIYSQLLYWMSGQTAITFVLVILSLVAFPSAPPTPPSKSRLLLEGSPNTTERWSGMKTTLAIMKNGYFLLFMISAGIRIAGNGAVPAILNELIHAVYPDRDIDVAYIGLTSQLCGLVAMFITAVVLDLTKTYYLLSMVTNFIALLSLGGFVAAIEFQSNFYILYPLVTIFSISNTAYLAVAYEYASEMTYPLPEGTSGGLINWGSRPFTILMVIVGPMFMELNGRQMPIGAWTIVLLLFFGAVLALFIRPELKKNIIDKKQDITTSTKS